MLYVYSFCVSANFIFEQYFKFKFNNESDCLVGLCTENVK